MQFNDAVLAELAGIEPSSQKEQESEMYALLALLCQPGTGKELLFKENAPRPALQKCFTLLEKASKISNMRDFGHSDGMEGIKIPLPARESRRLSQAILQDGTLSESLLATEKQRKAAIRGVVLAGGFFSDPEKEYLAELLFRTAAQREQVKNLLSGFFLEWKESTLHRQPGLYARDAQVIADLLALTGAGESVMALENARVLRQFRGNINRQVNCETANIAKTVQASRRQVEDIEYLAEHGILESLPQPLQEMARVRRAHPDASLTELGELLTPPVGKSGVNHRLRRLSEAARSARQKSRDT